MAIHGFFGTLGDGKTTLANYFMKELSDKGKKIISHAKLNIPYTHMDIEEIFDKAINDTLFFSNKILFMDEFHLIMESRRSSASVNVDFSQSILIQLGKIDCDLFYTAQLLSQMDLRIKQMQKYFYFCTKRFRLHDIESYLLEQIDFDRRIVKNPITNESIPIDIKVIMLVQNVTGFKKQSFIMPWEELVKIFPKFNTREIVKFDRKKYLKS